MKKLILASQSPRRKELLEKCGLPFDIEAADIDETINTQNDLKDEIRKLSIRKAQKVLASHPESIVIGSDTIVVIDNIVLGKPSNRNEAIEMLHKLSGKEHHVITGIAIISNKKTYSDVSVNTVTFETLNDEEIEKYVDTNEPMDKAGAYAIQGIASRYIKKIDGDYYAIMGLPVSMVYEELKNISSY